jgi:hypothetical protein
LLVAVALVVNGQSVAQAQSASPDSLATPEANLENSALAPTGRDLRGTTRELPRGATALQYTGRALLFLPWAAIEIVTLPILGLVYVAEHLEIARDIGRFLGSDLELWRFKLGLYVQSQSGAGSPAPGIRIRGKDWVGEGSNFDLIAGFLSPRQNQVGLRATSRPTVLQGSVTALYSNLRDQPFYGVGPGSPDEKFAANRERGLVEASLILGPRTKFPLTFTGYYRTTRLSDPSDGDAVQSGFPFLYDKAQNSGYGGMEAGFAFDNRNNGRFSTSGVLAEVLGGVDHAATDNSDYTHYSAEIDAFLDLADRNRVLAFRVFAAGMEVDDPARLPYTELERPGGGNGLRGYNRFRFADLTQIVMTLAYRYRVTTTAQAWIFTDWGSVARSWEKMRLADTDPSIGMGVGLFRSSFLGFQAAVSPEGWQFYVGVQPIVERSSRRLR